MEALTSNKLKNTGDLLDALLDFFLGAAALAGVAFAVGFCCCWPPLRSVALRPAFSFFLVLPLAGVSFFCFEEEGFEAGVRSEPACVG
jgi:hypothetical protein